MEDDLSTPKKYTIGGIVVTGTDYLDKTVLISLSGLQVGEQITVPGDFTANAIRKLWEQGLFADVSIVVTKIQGENIFLEIQLEERPRISKFRISGVSKSEAEDVNGFINQYKNKVVTENVLINIHRKTKTYFVNNGFLRTEVTITQIPDTNLVNRVRLNIDIDKKNKVKINDIEFVGFDNIKEFQLRKAMKDTKIKHWYNIFHTSKFIESNYEKDKKSLVALLNSKGYRDAYILKDTIWDFDENTVNIRIEAAQGAQYFFRNITWEGNTKYTSDELTKYLGIKKGDIYNSDILNSRLFINGSSTDISSLYLNQGHLFFSVTPQELLVEGDSIDLNMVIYEGKPATINKVTVVGNDKTNDHVIMREIRTKPGDLFSYENIMRTQRELAQLKYFNPEKLGVNPKPNPVDGTVDIEYVVEEQPSDQVELSGGWGGVGGIVGTFGLVFNNFSAKNLFNKKAWQPLPTGDGQTLSLRANSNGRFFQSYNFSFIEPWLGGQKPNSFSSSFYHTRMNYGGQTNITGAVFGLGKRLRWPDDFFTLQTSVGYKYYEILSSTTPTIPIGYYNNVFGSVTFGRNSISEIIYPRSGSSFSIELQITPPYSVIDREIRGIETDYTGLSIAEKSKWLEYHKWKMHAEFYTKLTKGKKPIVFFSKVNFGLIGNYTSSLGNSPFERFYIGGAGLSNFNIDGREIISLRGYPDFNQWSNDANSEGGIAAAKYTAEVRFPLSLNPQATFFGLVFAEGGNNFSSLRDFDVYNMKRSVGVGFRAFLPMFGMLGFDYGWGFDPYNSGQPIGKGFPTFMIGGNISGW